MAACGDENYGLRLETGLFLHLTALGETEIKPGKHSEARIKHKAVAFGQLSRPLHSRYAPTEACVRWRMAVTHNRYKFVPALVSIIVFQARRRRRAWS